MACATAMASQTAMPQPKRQPWPQPKQQHRPQHKSQAQLQPWQQPPPWPPHWPKPQPKPRAKPRPKPHDRPDDRPHPKNKPTATDAVMARKPQNDTYILHELTTGPQKCDAEVLPLPSTDSTVQTSQRLEQKHTHGWPNTLHPRHSPDWLSCVSILTWANPIFGPLMPSHGTCVLLVCQRSFDGQQTDIGRTNRQTDRQTDRNRTHEHSGQHLRITPCCAHPTETDHWTTKV